MKMQKTLDSWFKNVLQRKPQKHRNISLATSYLTATNLVKRLAKSMNLIVVIFFLFSIGVLLFFVFLYSVLSPKALVIVSPKEMQEAVTEITTQMTSTYAFSQQPKVIFILSPFFTKSYGLMVFGVQIKNDSMTTLTSNSPNSRPKKDSKIISKQKNIRHVLPLIVNKATTLKNLRALLKSQDILTFSNSQQLLLVYVKKSPRTNDIKIVKVEALTN